MCGIAGVVGKQDNKELTYSMVKCLSHRGPDGFGVFSEGEIGMGQTRLSIIDLETGEQPMPNEDHTIWIVFNGEIYNFVELRKELIDRGHVFRSSSDTEVIIHGYEEYGLQFLQRLDGIFAFGLWDSNQRQFIIARDGFGIKPLYYCLHNGILYFASELKSILHDPCVPRQVNYQAVHYFMNLRFIPNQDTLFEGIFRFPPACYGVFKDSQLKISKYYHLSPDQHPKQDEQYYIDGIRHYLKEAVRKQMISDVPLGVTLSGGLDSSSIVAFMSQVSDMPVHTFSLGFNEPTDELYDARVVAEHFSTDHQEAVLPFDPLANYASVIWHVGEPKENILQGYLLSKFVKQHVKVVQGGLGGDEIFAGYFINRFMYPANHVYKFIPGWLDRRVFSPISQGLFSLGNRIGNLAWDEYRRGMQLMSSLGNPLKYYLILRNVWDHDRKMHDNIYGSVMRQQNFSLTRTQFEPIFSASSMLHTQAGMLDRALFTEFHTKMVNDFLMNEDATSMAHGLEVRVPFLDRDLVSFAMGIPSQLKMKNNQTKYLFRKAMEGILPAHTIQKKKWGFTFDPYQQFRKDLKTVAERILTKKRMEELGWFNYEYIHKIINHRPHPRLHWHYFYLWLVLGFHIWHDMYILGDVQNPNLDLEAYYHA